MSTSALSLRPKLLPVLSYLIAIMAVAASVIGGLGFSRVSGIAPSASLFSCAIMFVAWSRGTGPAVFATALTIAAFDYFFLHPVYSFDLQFKDVPQLVLFAVAALFVVSLCAAQRRATDSLRSARNEQQLTVQKLQTVNQTLSIENAERKIAEARARQAEASLQATIDTIPALAARHRADGEIEFVNQMWRNYTGLSEDFWNNRQNTIIHPEDRERGKNAWLKHLKTGEAFETEQRLRRADGEYRWHFLRRVPLRNENGDIIAWYGAGYDIEDRKRAESALRRSETYLTEAQKLSLTGSFTWDTASGRHYWSDVTYQIMQIDRNVDPSIDLIIQRTHPDDRLLMQREFDRAMQGSQIHDYELRLLMPDGQIKHLHIVARRVVYESGKQEVVGALRDVTEARRSQAALDAAQSALAHASRIATFGEISASIAHEVNQPLAAIVANGQACLRFLRREVPDLNDVRGAVEWIVKDGNRAAEVIQRVRGSLKKADTQKARLDVNDTIEEVVALLQRELKKNRVVLSLELDPVETLTIADRIELQQVIINLIMNGIESMQGTADRPRSLVIRSYVDAARQVVVAVKDSGTGLIGTDSERIFDAFFSTKSEGLGMGLSICRSIIEVHGGRLSARNNPEGPGATFEFTLPAFEADLYSPRHPARPGRVVGNAG